MNVRALAVRSRVPHGAPGFADPLTADLLNGGPLSRERFGGRWGDADAVRALADSKRRPLSDALARELADYHRRLGASDRSLANLDRLARGEAVATVTGQQPAPLGGPLYALHKAASAVGLASDAETRLGLACVPLYWMHAEDSDFDEVRAATLADSGLVLHDVSLPDALRRDGGLIGALPRSALQALNAEAAPALAEWPGGPAALAAWGEAVARGADLGEAMNAWLLAEFASSGLVVVDPRLPAFRLAAREIIDRYWARAASLATAARDAGTAVERLIGRRPLADSALDSFVFEIRDGARRKVDVAEAVAHPERTFSPSVALRPAVQDGVFPTIAMACGPGEVAYLAQLREVFAGVGVQPAIPVPRFSATWLPPAACEVLEVSGAQAWDLVTGADAVLAALAEARVPPAVRGELRAAITAAHDGLARFATASAQVDPSFPQMVDSARAKLDFQFSRLAEGLAGKIRHKLDREHPTWKRLRYVLMPGDKLQERRLSSLMPHAWRGLRVGSELAELATEHTARWADGVYEHWVLDA